MKRAALFTAVALVAGGMYLGLRPAPEAAALVGIWTQFPSSTEGDPLRFYYFHGQDGIGLYRYGKVGHNNTNSFDWRVEDGQLHLTFRKTGVHHHVPFHLETDPQGREWLVLADDPRGPGPTRYLHLREGMQKDLGGPLLHDAAPAPTGAGPLGGRLWLDLQRYATGGIGFSLYQLNPSAIDGRGVGWHHRGDFDDWSTESLSYRVTGPALELHFTLADEAFRTPFAVQGSGPERSLTLGADPRNFWHQGRFVDAGPSFGGFTAIAHGRGASH